MKPNTLKVEYVCGASFDKDGKPMEWEQVLAAMKTVEDEMLAQFKGFSKLKKFGAWINPAGDLVSDQCIVYTCYAPLETSEMTLRIVQAVCVGSFSQTSVPMVVSEVYCQF